MYFAFRAIGLNLCEEWPHELVQSLIDHAKQVPVEKLLNLYKSGAIIRSKYSLTTLWCLASKYCLVERLSIQVSELNVHKYLFYTYPVGVGTF